MSRWLFLPNDAIKDLITLASLPREKLSEFRGFLDSEDFRLTPKFYVKAADLLNISDEGAASLCSFINYVQKHRARSKQSRLSVLDELEHFLKTQSDPNRDKILAYIRENKNLLEGLFSDFPTYDFSSKVRGLETGPLPHLKEFRAYCDLRPVYNAEGDKIVSCFPVITCCLVTHSSESDEMKEVFVQLTESDIEEFSAQFSRLEKKLAELRNRFSSFLAKKMRNEP